MRIAVIIPCFRCSRLVLDVISKVGPEVETIFVVDDACPEKTGDLVRTTCADPRVKVIFNSRNLGVGGAVKAGYVLAHREGFDVAVKIDGDGQMDPAEIPKFVAPIQNHHADYTKGNRFFRVGDFVGMPRIRVFGNIGLSFASKISSGYWDIFDPANGYTAIHLKVFRELEIARVHDRFFFESDMLYQLGVIRAKIVDIPMRCIYAEEKSNLNEYKEIATFARSHLRNFLKRMISSYFFRNVNIASVNLLLGLVLIIFGASFGVHAWMRSAAENIPATSGTVMLSALPIIIGTNLLLSFLSYDISQTPRDAIHNVL